MEDDCGELSSAGCAVSGTRWGVIAGVNWDPFHTGKMSLWSASHSYRDDITIK